MDHFLNQLSRTDFTVNLTSNFVLGSCDGRHGLQRLLSNHGLVNSNLPSRRCCSLRDFRNRTLRVHDKGNADQKVVHLFLKVHCSLGMMYGPQLNGKQFLTFGGPRQKNLLEQEILNRFEGLGVIGVKPGEKLALFADNSCRWPVADQVWKMHTTGSTSSFI